MVSVNRAESLGIKFAKAMSRTFARGDTVAILMTEFERSL
jgi:hypothetical protein